MTPHDLLNAFETLAEAPDGIARLRELVLQLAVRGKLVPQDQNDEPACVLLERIAAEKVRLAKEGKLPKAKPLQPVSENEVPFAVPSGWVWCRFCDIANVASNLVDPSAFPDAPHVAPDSIEKATGRLLGYRTIAEDDVQSGKHRFFPGQILYSKIRPNLSKVIKVDFEGLCSADMYPIDAWIDRSYLHLYMLSPLFITSVTADDNRVAMPKVNQEQLATVPVSLPPLPEQHRIVAKVDTLMPLLDRLEAARSEREATRAALRDAALAALRKATDAEAVEAAWTRIAERTDDLFTDPADVAPLRQTLLQLAVRGKLVPQDPKDESACMLLERITAEKARLVQEEKIPQSKPLPLVDENEMAFEIPEGWMCIRMDEVCDIVSGVTKGRKLDGRETAIFPYLRVANVQADHLDLSVIKEIEIPPNELEQYRLVPGDVLLTEGGDWDKLGRSAIWAGEIENCIHQNHIFRARSLDSGLLPRWVSMFTNSPDGRAYFQSCSKQTTNLASINKTQLRSCPLPTPPTAEQHRIVAKVDALMALCDALDGHLVATREAQAAFAAAAVHHLDV